MKQVINKQNLDQFLRRTTVLWILVFALVIAIIGIIIGLMFDWRIGATLALIVLIGMAFSFARLRQINDDTEAYLNQLAVQVNQSQEEALLEMPIGLILLDDENIIKWINPYMAKYFDPQEMIVGRKLAMVDDDLAKLVAKHRHDEQTAVIDWKEHKFELQVQDRYNTVYLTDITEYEEISDRYQREQLFLGNIFLDNYDEITKGMSDSMVSNLSNYVTSQLSQWAKDHDLLLKVIDDDNYLLVGHNYSLKALENENFDVLDTIRKNTSQQNSPVTISMGIAYGQSNLIKLANMAQKNLDLSLGRGGDQVVVRMESGQARFFGGKTNPMEKRTRVRARMISQALHDLMNQADNIFVIGHTRPDLDSLGACFGIRRLAEMNDHESWIVLDDDETNHSDIERLMGEVDNYQSIKEHIINPEEALKKATDASLLIMVDHSKPSLSASPKLTERLANRIVIIDHHRRGEEFPENPLLVYIEPYASSTCELITEMFEYQPRESKGLNKLEATAMLAGIRIDTKSFSQNAGTRTYDAASYLRSAGADGTMIQYLTKETPANFIQRNHLIDTAEFIDDSMAICAGADDQTYDSVIAAQAADMLLQVSGIKASFVITRQNADTVGISARSIGDFNVQVIMERLGGGGHLTNAATQIKDTMVDEVKTRLITELTSDEETEAETEEE